MRQASRLNGSRGCVSRMETMESLGSVVYVARLSDGIIKIGWTQNFGNRLRYLKSQNRQSVTLLAFMFGDRDDEQEIHAQLTEHRARGREFYHPHPDVLAIVNTMRGDLGMEPI